MSTPSTSAAAFLLHPLIAHGTRVTPEEWFIFTDQTAATWHCLAPIPDHETYMYAPDPAERQATDTDWASLSTGSRREVGRIVSAHMTVLGTDKAVLDRQNKKLYVINLVGESDGKLCLTLIHYTRKEAKAQARGRLMHYAAAVQRICTEQYAMKTTTMSLNVFFSGPLEDEINVKEMHQRRHRRRPPRHRQRGPGTPSPTSESSVFPAPSAYHPPAGSEPAQSTDR